MPIRKPTYSSCPNCSSTRTSFVRQCNKCGQVFCGTCGHYQTSCPKCKSSNTKQLGELGEPYYEP